jgi:hypothetical protein
VLVADDRADDVGAVPVHVVEVAARVGRHGVGHHLAVGRRGRDLAVRAALRAVVAEVAARVAEVGAAAREVVGVDAAVGDRSHLARAGEAAVVERRAIGLAALHDPARLVVHEAVYGPVLHPSHAGDRGEGRDPLRRREDDHEPARGVRTHDADRRAGRHGGRRARVRVRAARDVEEDLAAADAGADLVGRVQRAEPAHGAVGGDRGARPGGQPHGERVGGHEVDELDAERREIPHPFQAWRFRELQERLAAPRPRREIARHGRRTVHDRIEGRIRQADAMVLRVRGRRADRERGQRERRDANAPSSESSSRHGLVLLSSVWLASAE